MPVCPTRPAEDATPHDQNNQAQPYSLILNSDLIEHIEMTPDTVITLTSGQKYMVLETTEEIIERVVSFRQSLLRNQPLSPRRFRA